MGVVFISPAASVERNLLFVSVDAPIIPPPQRRHCSVGLPSVGVEAGSILCTGHSWRPQPAAVSKFKGLQADLLSSAFQWAEVGWCKQPLQRTSSESCKPGGCKGWVLGKGLRLPVVQMLMSLFPPSRRSIQEQWVLATSKTRMILCAPQRALNKARVEIVHKHKKRDRGKLGEPDTLTFLLLLSEARTRGLERHRRWCNG